MGIVTNCFAEGNWTQTTLTKPYLSTLINTHFGVYVGELDLRGVTNKYNGLYVSKDLGEVWNEVGEKLNKRGITDLFYDKETQALYAATYYFVKDLDLNKSVSGLYVSHDHGLTWTHMGPEVSTTKIIGFSSSLLLGTYSHGLWLSQDNGETWNQVIGSGFFGPKISMLQVIGNDIYVSSDLKTYKSTDGGVTWSIVLGLEEAKLTNLTKAGDIFFGGSNTLSGMFYSTDGGNSWQKDAFWNNKQAFCTSYFPFSKALYACSKTSAYVSYDFGKNWQNLNAPFTKDPTALTWVFTPNSKLFAITSADGVLAYNMPARANNINGVFNQLWDESYVNESVDTISAYFDHAYPLLGYSLYSEPAEQATTTTNYLGEIGGEPFMYYSGHDGIDFALNYGTPIKTPASGHAQYYYQKGGLGHHIKITHQNGLQSIYGHLQKEIAEDYASGSEVVNGDVIGKVGMSGNTTGPHLHFTVLQDLNDTGDFLDDIPEGKTDPFGWQGLLSSDPWENFTWSDANGTHTTGASTYLWVNPLQSSDRYKSGEESLDQFFNLEILFPETDHVYSAFLNSVPSKSLNRTDDKLTTPPNSAVKIDLFDTFGSKVTQIGKPTRLTFGYEGLLQNIDEQTLKILHFNEIDSLWEELNSTIDMTTKKIWAETTSFSMFALVGQKLDYSPPTTKIEVTGLKLGDTFINAPTIELIPEDVDYQSQSLTTLFSLNDNEWAEYEAPFMITGDDLIPAITLKVKSLDEFQNVEEVKTVTIKTNIRTDRKKIIIKDATFTTN